MTTQPWITPELPIDSIVVGKRHRKDPGDIKELVESIDSIGLIHPVVVKPDNTLIAGQRRLLALRELGWDSVPVTVIHTLNGAVDELLAERDENTCRKDMTVSEMATLGALLEGLERPGAEERQQEAGRFGSEGGRGKQKPLATADAKGFDLGESPRTPRTTDRVGEALGVSGRQYERIRDVHKTATGKTDDPSDVVEVAKHELKLVDKGKTSVTAAHGRIKDARNRNQPSGHKGRSHQKQQLRTLESVKAQLSGIASALQLVFDDGGFEKTCTPAIAAEYANLFKADIREINKTVSRLEQHGKEEKCSVA